MTTWLQEQAQTDEVRDILIGRWTADEGQARRTGYRMEVSFGLKQHTEREFITMEHEQIGEYTEFTASGGIYRNGGESSFGQNLDHLRQIERVEPPFTRADVRSLRMIWERWHLNGMHAECAHLERQWEDSTYGKRLKLDGPGTVCPESGYRMGWAWLVEPLPDIIITEVRRLLAVARSGQ